MRIESSIIRLTAGCIDYKYCTVGSQVDAPETVASDGQTNTSGEMLPNRCVQSDEDNSAAY